jgi:hypothetical protein
MPMIERPSFIPVEITLEKYRRWLDRKSVALVRRDTKRGNTQATVWLIAQPFTAPCSNPVGATPNLIENCFSAARTPAPARDRASDHHPANASGPMSVIVSQMALIVCRPARISTVPPSPRVAMAALPVAAAMVSPRPRQLPA